MLVTRTRARLADLHYDFDALAALMQEHGLITVLLVWPEGRKLFHARNPFAGSGVVEDPATGAAAAAFGGYLRDLHKIGAERRVHHLPGRRHGPPEPHRRERPQGRARRPRPRRRQRDPLTPDAVSRTARIAPALDGASASSC